MKVHLNGKLVPAEEARVGVFDRGFLFGDGIYEGLRTFGGNIIGLDRHLARMGDGLEQTDIPWDPGQLKALTDELLAANGLEDAFVYWQITRGEPAPGEPVRARVLTGQIRPTVFAYCTELPSLDQHTEPRSCDAVLTDDVRWLKGRVKSISLLGNVLCAIEATKAGVAESLMTRGELVAEASASNVILALPGDDGATELVTPSLESVPILGGVTRAMILEAVPEIAERAVGVEELAKASEILLVGTMAMITSVTKLDGRVIGDGTPGPQARRLFDALVDAIGHDVGLS